MIALDPMGDRAFLARFASEDEARGWREAAESSGLPGVVEVVLAFDRVAVYADPNLADLDALAAALGRIETQPSPRADGRLHRIPVLYDGEDLGEVAALRGIGSDAVVAAHAGRDYRVLAVGFLPGFPYAGDLPPELSGLARRESPRPRVPAGSVAIAGRMTCVYPRDSPGGWHLLGRTPLTIADEAEGYFPVRAGDRLAFDPIDPGEYLRRMGERLDGVHSPPEPRS